MAFRPLLCIRIDDDTVLRLYEERHAQEVAELVDENRAYLRQWLPWVDNSRSVEDSRAFIRGSLQQFAQNEGFQMGIWFRNTFAGGIGYHQLDWADRKVEIGYWLDEAFQGKGLMTKACRTLIAYAFTELGVNDPTAKAEDLRLSSTATLHIFADVQLWLHRSTHRGVLTRRPYSSSLAGQAAF
jgi:ribosomal-protein-serine acetyltransferase